MTLDFDYFYKLSLHACADPAALSAVDDFWKVNYAKMTWPQTAAVLRRLLLNMSKTPHMSLWAGNARLIVVLAAHIDTLVAYGTPKYCANRTLVEWTVRVFMAYAATALRALFRTKARTANDDIFALWKVTVAFHAVHNLRLALAGSCDCVSWALFEGLQLPALLDKAMAGLHPEAMHCDAYACAHTAVTNYVFSVEARSHANNTSHILALLKLWLRFTAPVGVLGEEDELLFVDRILQATSQLGIWARRLYQLGGSHTYLGKALRRVASPHNTVQLLRNLKHWMNPDELAECLPGVAKFATTALWLWKADPVAIDAVAVVMDTLLDACGTTDRSHAGLLLCAALGLVSTLASLGTDTAAIAPLVDKVIYRAHGIHIEGNLGVPCECSALFNAIACVLVNGHKDCRFASDEKLFVSLLSCPNACHVARDSVLDTASVMLVQWLSTSARQGLRMHVAVRATQVYKLLSPWKYDQTLVRLTLVEKAEALVARQPAAFREWRAIRDVAL